MKLNGFVGKGTGKLGASVFAISGGEQIVRQYNPKVSNPNTDAQAEQRAKLKLMSQLAADLAQTIGFQKKGLVSARNQFISANIGNCQFENNKASISIASLDLTGGSKAFSYPSVQAGGQVALATAAPAGVTSVLYAAYVQDSTGQLQLVEQKIVSEAGNENKFPTSMTLPAGHYFVCAYGIMNNGQASTLSYEDYILNDVNGSGELGYIRSVIVRGGTLTKTTWWDDEIS